MASDKLLHTLKRQEGYSRNPYKCTEEFTTIAYGRNLDTVGIDQEEAEYLLKRDVARCEEVLSTRVRCWDRLSRTRKDALVNMAFQIGVSGLFKFKNMLARLEAGEYRYAALEAMDSKWARQTPKRAAEVSEMIRTGEY